MVTRTLSRWLLSVGLTLFALIAINLLVTTSPVQGRPASSLINCSGSIQACIDAANDGDTILIAAGRYTESLTLSKPVSLTGENRDTTILHAVAGQRVLTVTGATISNSVVISGLTFTGGSADYGGGVLLTNDAQPLIRDSIFSNNIANGDGGGLYFSAVFGALALTNTQFINNSAQGRGGGLAVSTLGAVTMYGGRFERNHSTQMGGALWVDTPVESVTMIATNFISNTANDYGGGIAGDPWVMNVLNCHFENNASLSGMGGGLYTFRQINLTNTQFISNSAPYGGGGVQGGYGSITGGRFERNSTSEGFGGGWEGGNLIMSGTLFINNTAAYGGGGMSALGDYAQVNNGRFEGNRVLKPYPDPQRIYGGGGMYTFAMRVNITDTQFISNSSVGTGGGLYSIRDSQVVNALFANNISTVDGAAMYFGQSEYATQPPRQNLSHLTIADTTVNLKAAISILSSTLNLTNTIIANHAIGISNTGGTVYEDDNLFYNVVTNTIGVTSGGHSLIGDPKFADPLNGNYHLQFGSAAIDHGVDAGVYTDLDGNLRPHGAGFDIGAYEFSGGPRYVATTGDDTSNDCTNSSLPCATVQHAIDVANGGEQVLIASGLYTQSATLYKPVSVTGVNSATTIIHAVEGQRVLTVTGATISNSVVISGLTLTGGDVTGGWNCPAYCGGGIYIDNNAQPLIHNMILRDNRAGTGGGLYANNGIALTQVQLISNTSQSNGGGGLWANSSLALFKVDIIDNAGWSTGGGAIVAGYAIITSSRFINNRTFGNNYACGGLCAGGSLTISDTEFINNASYGGGGLMQVNGGPVHIIRSRFERNDGEYGGGLAIFGSDVTLIDTDFVSNTSSGGSGAFIDSPSLTMVGGRFEGNSCRSSECTITSGGGMIFSGTMAVTGTTFTNNSTAYQGGAIDFLGGKGRFVNTLFERNFASSGAAIYFESSSNSEIVNSTFVSPTVADESVIAILTGTLNLTNTIIANHAIGISNTAGTVYEDYNLFFNTITNTVGVTSGGHSLVGDPKFVDPLNGNYYVQFGSAAIDHGVDAGVYTDLDGNPRPVGAGFDIGAYEYLGGHYYLWLPLIRK